MLSKADPLQALAFYENHQNLKFCFTVKAVPVDLNSKLNQCFLSYYCYLDM